MIDLGSVKKEIKDNDIVNLSDSDLKFFLNNLIINYYNKENIEIGLDDIKKLSKTLFNEYRGLGIIEEFLEDENINEIMINDYNEIFLEINGNIEKSNLYFSNIDEYNRIIQKIVSYSGREVNISNPIVDSILYDGSRANIILPPITKKSPCVTIRKFPKNNLTMKDLIEKGTISLEISLFLEKLVKSKYNIIIGGGTSSGKTTFLNALSEYIDDCERIITIEDSRELKIINKNNLISLETRNSNNQKISEITIKDLIKNSLRMRPDRIIVGEVRADETLDMLQAMNTGHEGSLTTAHANSTKDMISRLETMVLRSSSNIPIEAVKRMINSSIEILIQLSKVGRNMRKVVEISELLQDSDGKTKLNILYDYDYTNGNLIKKGNLINDNKLRRLI